MSAETALLVFGFALCLLMAVALVRYRWTYTSRRWGTLAAWCAFGIVACGVWAGKLRQAREAADAQAKCAHAEVGR